MRAIQAAATALDVPCGSTELQAVILNQPLGSHDTHRHNSTCAFASAVADRVDHHGEAVAAAIGAQFEADVRLALRVPAMSCAFSDADDYAAWMSRGSRGAVNLWHGRGSLTVSLARRRASAHIAELERAAAAAVADSAARIDRERRDALADQHGGQLALL